MVINPKKIRIDEFSYSLPDEKIAKYPLEQRDQSKLLIYNKGDICKDNFTNLGQYLQTNNTLVFNNTKVIQARLKFAKLTGAQIEIFCLEPIEPSDYVLAFQQRERIKWKCIVGNLKKWKSGELIKTIAINSIPVELKAKKLSSEQNSQIIEFSWDNTDFTFSEILENIGLTPIPPYLNRDSESIDKDRYQTVYSKLKGSVAAPTAGLHFSDKILQKLTSSGISLEEITLHVGAGTFKPVQTETIDCHEMHTEHFVVTKRSLLNILGSKIITAVGTTSVRTLESIYWLGVKLIQSGNIDFYISQWEAYELPDNIDKEEAFGALLNYMDINNIEELHASTQIMIFPGYTFNVVNTLITNFHQPKSTLLLLIAAFIGENWRNVYEYALQNEFRFLSYGDSSLLIP